jgi:hypothetical protein
MIPTMKRTLFMHIPKTAGMSVLLYLRHVYAAQPRLELRWQDNSLQSVRGDAVANAANIWLHEPLRDLRYDTGGFFKFTFLRDPIDRVGSLFAYLRDPAVIDRQDFTRTPAQVVSSLRSIGRMSFKDFVLSDDPVHVGHIANVYPNYFAAQKESAFAKTEDYLRHCLQRMDECFDLIGATSQLSEDMSLIRKHCFPKSTVSFARMRVNESNRKGLDLRLSSDMGERLEAMLALDLALFRQAGALRLKKRAALEGWWRRLSPWGKFRRRAAQPQAARPA